MIFHRAEKNINLIEKEEKKKILNPKKSECKFSEYTKIIACFYGPNIEVFSRKNFKNFFLRFW